MTDLSTFGYGSTEREEVERDVSVVIKHMSEFRADLLPQIVESSTFQTSAAPCSTTYILRQTTCSVVWAGCLNN